MYSASWETHLRATGRHLPYVHILCSLIYCEQLSTIFQTLTHISVILICITPPVGGDGGVANALVSINEVTLCWAQLKLVWAGKPSRYATKYPGQLNLLPSVGR